MRFDQTPNDPKDRMRLREAEAVGAPFIVFHDGTGLQCIAALGTDRAVVVIGRSTESDVPIPWDNRVSRTHAQFVRVGTRWSVDDDGLSRNGTFVNEDRISTRRRLHDGDVVRVGHTALVFRDPVAGSSLPTAPESRLAEPPALSAGQRRVLEALCRPCLATGGPHAPAANEQISAELFLSVDAVKAQLRQLFRRFDIEDLPQIQKRTALVRLAIESGVLRSHS
jgi:DNA-binding CsgD family transcriptional regulator